MDEFLHVGLGLPRYDRVALPGGAACLAGHLVKAYYDKVALERQIEFLVSAHLLTRIVLIAHQGCGFYKDAWTNGGSIEQLQRDDLHAAAEVIRAGNGRVTVETFFARRVDGRVAFECWDVEPLETAREATGQAAGH
jgi:hypothetical protein